MINECWGITKRGQRCKLRAKFIFCRKHIFQPIIFLLVTLPALIADWSTVCEKFFNGSNSNTNEPGLAESDSILLPELVMIPEGYFLMCNSENSKDIVNSQKYLSPYLIGRYEISNRQYKKFLDEDTLCFPPTIWKNNNFSTLDQPVVGINWYEANKYCEWLSKKTGKKYSLPSEQQWVKAARGTTDYLYPWGNTPPNRDKANFNNRYGAPDVIISHQSGRNPEYRTQNMAGNVAEWCNDEIYNDVIVKGGSFEDDPIYLKIYFQRKVVKTNRIKSIGFRVVCLP